MSASSVLKQYKRRLGRILAGSNPQDLAWLLCRGKGLEVGARSNPYKFREANVKYADIASNEVIEKVARSSPRVGVGLENEKTVKIDYVLKAPKYAFDDIQDNEFDFVFSDNVIEHTPNPIFALIEQIRIVKPAGIVYSILPNKHFTFDCERDTTELGVLVEKYVSGVFDHTIAEALDVIQNTVDYPDRNLELDSQMRAARDMIARKDGVPHFHVFDEKNTLNMISFISESQSVAIVHYSALSGKNIHFAFRKY
jgi:SAM-dependent methyltransferase